MYVVYKRMYMHAQSLEAVEPTVFMVWLRTCLHYGKFPQTLYRNVSGLYLFCVKQSQTLYSEDLFYIILKYLCILRSFFK